jgi:hypothetical protein
MTKSLAIGGAMLALAMFGSATTLGVNALNAISRVDTRVPAITRIGSVQTFNGRVGTSGLEMGTGRHYKKPIDSDGGGPNDPPKKDPTKTTDTGSGGDYYGPHPPYWHNPHRYGDGSTPPLACKGRPGGC